VSEDSGLKEEEEEDNVDKESEEDELPMTIASSFFLWSFACLGATLGGFEVSLEGWDSIYI
jgi:hypothetical protein